MRVGTSNGRRLFVLPAAPAAEPRSNGAPDQTLTIRRAAFNLGTFDLQIVTDGNPDTVWATPKPQRGGEEIVVELDDVKSVAGVSLSTGPPLEGYPRQLEIATSIDGQTWEAAWTGGMAGPAIEGILRNPRTAESRVAFATRSARFVRIRQLGMHPESGWFIAELKIFGLLPS
jgi:hypothetical protein